MLRFEFDARNIGTEGAGTLVVEIDAPRPVAGYPDDYECPIRFSGVICREMRGVGAFPFQAVDLSLKIAKAFIQSHQNDWEFSSSQQGPVTFEY